MDIYIKEETLDIFKETPGEEETGRFFVISTADDLAKEFDKPKLLVLLAKARGTESATEVDGKKSLKKLAFEVFKELTKDPVGQKPNDGGTGNTGGKPNSNKAPRTPRTDSKSAKLRAYLAEHPVATQDELAAASGYDARNTHTAMSIFKNEGRTKEPIFSTYDKTTKTYTVHPSKEAMETASEQMKIQLEADKKAAAEKAAEEKKAAAEKAAAEKKAAEEKAAAEKAAAEKAAGTAE